MGRYAGCSIIYITLVSNGITLKKLFYTDGGLFLVVKTFPGPFFSIIFFLIFLCFACPFSRVSISGLFAYSPVSDDSSPL